MILSLLPIFETYPPEASEAVPVLPFRALLGAGPVFLPPPAIPKDILTHAFLKCIGAQDELLATAVGVGTVTEAEFYVGHILAKPAALSQRTLVMAGAQVGAIACVQCAAVCLIVYFSLCESLPRCSSGCRSW